MIHLYHFAYALTRALPMTVVYAMAVFVADCHYLISRADRQRVRSNLKVIYGKEQVAENLVREVFRNFGRYLAEFITMTKRVDLGFIKDHIRVEGLKNVDEALKLGKGCVIVSAHWGNWEMASAILSKLGYPLSVVALPHKDTKVNTFFNNQREFFGTIVVPTNTAIRRCLENLHANQVVALLADRDFGLNGLVMDFLGRQTMMPKGPALFSFKTGAPIVVCFLARTSNNDFQVTFGPPSLPPVVKKGKISDQDIKSFINRYRSALEEQIRKDPSQWLMFREFWVTP